MSACVHVCMHVCVCVHVCVYKNNKYVSNIKLFWPFALNSGSIPRSTCIIIMLSLLLKNWDDDNDADDVAAADCDGYDDGNDDVDDDGNDGDNHDNGDGDDGDLYID